MGPGLQPFGRFPRFLYQVITGERFIAVFYLRDRFFRAQSEHGNRSRKGVLVENLSPTQFFYPQNYKALGIVGIHFFFGTRIAAGSYKNFNFRTDNLRKIAPR